MHIWMHDWYFEQIEEEAGQIGYWKGDSRLFIKFLTV